MSLSTRRQFLSVLGGGVILAAGCAGTWVATRTPIKALAPWSEAGNPALADPRVRALSYAILAPNPHNRQPWLVDLATPGVVTLYCELDRRLPETDPDDRQITVGLGCFVELLRMAAAADGQRTEVISFPDGEPSGRLDKRCVAEIRFTPQAGIASDPLFAEVLNRRSLKEPFDLNRPVDPATLAKLLQVPTNFDTTDSALTPRFSGTTEKKEVAAWRELAWEGHRIESLTARTMQESIDLMRFGRSHIEASPDGIDLGGPFLEALHLAGQLDPEQLADPQSQAFAQGMAIYEEMISSAQGWVWMTTPANTRADQLRAGAAWLRINLQATALGLGFHPLSQTLQEYPEMAALYRTVHEKVGATGTQTVQMLARLGYAERPAPSPRWPLETRIRS